MLWTPAEPEYREQLLCWAEARLPYVGGGLSRAGAIPVGVLRDDKLVAVVIFHQRRAATIEASVAADTPRWATRQVFAALLAYPFLVLGCGRLTLIIAAKNRRSKRLARGVGFVEEGFHPGWFQDDDALTFGMTRQIFERSRWALALAQPAAMAA